MSHVVTEGISGYCHYHISTSDRTTRALCGAKTMQTDSNIADFGVPFGGHFPKRPTWCSECKKLYEADK